MSEKTITPDFLSHKKRYNKGQEEMIYIKNPLMNLLFQGNYREQHKES